MKQKDNWIKCAACFNLVWNEDLEDDVCLTCLDTFKKAVEDDPSLLSIEGLQQLKELT